MTIFKKIRERRLFQIAASYVVGGWAVLGVFDQLVDRGIFNEVVYKMALIWLVVGIPAALLVGWHHGEKGAQTAPRSEIVSLVLLLFVALGLSGMTYRTYRVNAVAEAQLKAVEDNPIEARRLAVLYFRDNSGEGKYEYVADALTESLIDQLGQVRDLDVISRNGSARFRNSELAPDSIASLLGAGTIVDGTIEERGDQLRVVARVIDGKGGGDVGEPVSFQIPISDVVAATDSLAALTSERLRGRLGQQVRIRDSERGTHNTRAWLLLQRAEKARKNAELLPPTDSNAVKLFADADALLQQAAKAEPQWVEPVVARASMSYRRAYRLQASKSAAEPLVRQSIQYSEEALKRDKNNPRALELRGTANFFLYLLDVTPDPAARAQLMASGKTDLLAAVGLDPSLATAHATLSFVHMLEGDMTSTVIQAKTAYDEDAYLEAADLVLWRLVNASWELGDFTNAVNWCDTGKRRFPTNFRFASCSLRLLTLETANASADSAWGLLTLQDSLVPPARRAIEHLKGEMMVAGALARHAAHEPARAQLFRDSARQVLDRASRQGTPQVDPFLDLAPIEAYIRTILGDKDQAIALLERSKARDASQYDPSKGLDKRWYWADLQSHPRFNALFGLK